MGQDCLCRRVQHPRVRAPGLAPALSAVPVPHVSHRPHSALPRNRPSPADRWGHLGRRELWRVLVAQVRLFPEDEEEEEGSQSKLPLWASWLRDLPCTFTQPSTHCRGSPAPCAHRPHRPRVRTSACLRSVPVPAHRATGGTPTPWSYRDLHLRPLALPGHCEDLGSRKAMHSTGTAPCFTRQGSSVLKHTQDGLRAPSPHHLT